jgi:hypothetical protein
MSALSGACSGSLQYRDEALATDFAAHQVRSAFIGVPQGDSVSLKPLTSFIRRPCRNNFAPATAPRCATVSITLIIAATQQSRVFAASVRRNLSQTFARPRLAGEFIIGACANGSTLPRKLGDIKYRKRLTPGA